MSSFFYNYTPGNRHPQAAILWDVNLETLDYNKAKNFVIERIVTLGTFEDYYAGFDLYGYDEFRKTALNLKGLQPIDKNFIDIVFK